MSYASQSEMSIEMGQMDARRPPTPPPFGPIDDDKHAPGAGASRRSSAGDVVCPICLADTVDNKNHHFVKFICGHQFHASCYFPWHLKSSICPYCKHAAFLPNPISLLIQKIMPGVNEALFPPIPQLSDQLQPYWLHLNLDPELENIPPALEPIKPVWKILEAIRKLFDREKLENYMGVNRGLLAPALAAQESYKNECARWSNDLYRVMRARFHELQNFLQRIDILLTNHPRIYNQIAEIFRQLFPEYGPPSLEEVKAILRDPGTLIQLASAEPPPPSYAVVAAGLHNQEPVAPEPPPVVIGIAAPPGAPRPIRRSFCRRYRASLLYSILAGVVLALGGFGGLAAYYGFRDVGHYRTGLSESLLGPLADRSDSNAVGAQFLGTAGAILGLCYFVCFACAACFFSRDAD